MCQNSWVFDHIIGREGAFGIPILRTYYFLVVESERKKNAFWLVLINEEGILYLVTVVYNLPTDNRLGSIILKLSSRWTINVLIAILKSKGNKIDKGNGLVNMSANW